MRRLFSAITTPPPKKNVQCAFELSNGLSCINIPSDLKYFSLHATLRPTHVLKPTLRKTVMKLHLDGISSVGTMTGYRLKTRGSISDTEVCEMYWLCGPWRLLSIKYRRFFSSV